MKCLQDSEWMRRCEMATPSADCRCLCVTDQCKLLLHVIDIMEGRKSASLNDYKELREIGEQLRAVLEGEK